MRRNSFEAGVGSESGAAVVATISTKSSINKKQKKTGNIDNSHEPSNDQGNPEDSDQDCTHRHKSTLRHQSSCHSSNLMASNLPELMDIQDNFPCPEAEIEHWKKVVRNQRQEIIELKSQLDKFQALFQFSGITASGSGALTIPSNAAVSAKKRTRTRLFGISAEPGPVDIESGDKVPEQIQTYPKSDA